MTQIRQLVGVALCVWAGGLPAQVVSGPVTPAERIAEAEATGASWPRARPSDTQPRKCLIVKPEQIGFPSSRGEPGDFYLESGDFSAGSISFGWDSNYEQAKMPLTPRYPEAIGKGLRLVLTRIDPPGGTVRLDVPGFPPHADFFATWPRFATPGRWMIVATAGANWGCFVLDRPVKP